MNGGVTKIMMRTNKLITGNLIFQLLEVIIVYARETMSWFRNYYEFLIK